MKKNLLQSFGIALCLLAFGSKAQTYSAWGQAINQTGHMYDTISASGDSLKFKFVNTHATAYGAPQLIVYYEGNFGDYFEGMDVFDETLGYQGSTNPSIYGDCGQEDSTIINLSPADINTWTANNNIIFTILPHSSPTCPINRVRARLVYNYCLSGLPFQYASATISNAFVCSSDAPYALTGTPSGGTFSGPGVTGTSFSPAGLTSGNYVINYTATDSHTCTTTGSLVVFVKPRPIVNNNSTVYACNGSTASLNAALGSGPIIWYSDAALTNTLANTHVYATPSLTQTTTYYVVGVDQNSSLLTTTLTSASSAIVDEDNLAGDDRGGIAVTQTHVYLNGDNNAVRYDLNLTPSSGVSLPIRDGMFSDLRSGKLWSLWNSTLNIAPGNNNTNNFDANALRGLDSNLNFTNEYVYFTQTVNMGNNNQQNGIFAGAGMVGLYSGNTQHWYVVDIDNGSVSDLGYLNDPQFYGSENWSDWGVLESTCGNSYSVIYRDYNDANIHRRALPNGTVTTVGNFSDLSDLASLTYNPWNHRWYWHYEGSGTVFGGNSETLGYANATFSVGLCGGSGLSCPTKVTVHVPADVTLSVPVTAICLSEDAVMLNGGSPAGGIYSGIGVGTNTSGTVFYPALAGAGTFTINYTHTDSASSCTDVASRTVSVDLCTGIAVQTAVSRINIFPNPGTGNFYFTVNSDISALQIEVTDIQGRVIYAANEKDLASGTTKHINLNGMNEGMYLLKLSGGSSQRVQRLIITH